MNKKSVVLLILLLTASFVLSSCFTVKPVLGIDRPIVIKDIDFLFYEVETMESFQFGTNTTRPSAPYNMLLSIKATTENVDPLAACDWTGEQKMKLAFLKNGEVDEVGWGICGGDTDEDWIHLIFATYENGVTDYEIVFPDGQRVPLDELIDLRTGETL